MGATPPAEHSAVILKFPTNRTLTCWTCSFWRSIETDIAGPVSFCVLYTEVIDSEVWSAQGCLGYDRCEENTQPDDLPDDILGLT